MRDDTDERSRAGPLLHGRWGSAMAVTTSLLVTDAPSSVGRARHAFAAFLSEAGVGPDAVEDAVLVLSELVSNSVRHAAPLPSGEIRVGWRVDYSGVEVAVTDGGGATRPLARHAAAGATGGRGLAIVAELARDWGVVDGDCETTVWAVLLV